MEAPTMEGGIRDGGQGVVNEVTFELDSDGWKECGRGEMGNGTFHGGRPWPMNWRD